LFELFLAIVSIENYLERRWYCMQSNGSSSSTMSWDFLIKIDIEGRSTGSASSRPFEE
jgi:hypothetical protein